MNTPLAVRIECAKGEILNAMETIQKRHALPPCIMDGVLSSVLAEVRSEAKIELINSTNTMMAEKNEELEKAKKAAKRVLKTEPDEEQPEQDDRSRTRRDCVRFTVVEQSCDNESCCLVSLLCRY